MVDFTRIHHSIICTIIFLILTCKSIDATLQINKLMKCSTDTKFSTIDCGPNKVMMVKEWFYGVSATNTCKHDAGDCVEKLDEMTIRLYSRSQTRFVFPKYSPLSTCQHKKSTYLVIEYYCVPTINDNTNDICDTSTNQLQFSSGIISTHNGRDKKNCFKNLLATDYHLYQIFIIKMTLDCKNGNMTVLSGNNGKVEICGRHTYVPLIIEDFCSSSIAIKLISSKIDAFSIYYQQIIREPLSLKCSFKPLSPGDVTTPITDTPTMITTTLSGGITPTTTLKKTTLPMELYQIQHTASPVKSAHLCVKEREVVRTPAGFHLIVIKSYKGISMNQICTKPTSKDCKESVSPPFCYGQTCTFHLYMATKLLTCNNHKADYFHVDYQFVPDDFHDADDVCAGQSITVNKAFVESTADTETCSRVYHSTSPSKIWRVFVLKAQYSTPPPGPDNKQQCLKNSVLTVSDGTFSAEVCGYRDNSYLFESCSEKLIISSVGSQALHLYIEASEWPGQHSCNNVITKPTPFTTLSPYTGPTTTITPPPIKNVISDVINLNSCTGHRLNLMCNQGTSILIDSSTSGVHSNPKDCIYRVTDCYHDETHLARETCAGYRTCQLYVDEHVLAQCQLKSSTYQNVKYRCVPNQTDKVNKKDICSSDSKTIVLNEDNPSIVLTGSSSTNNIYCSQLITAPNNYVIDLYYLSMSTYPGKLTKCSVDELYVTDGKIERKVCGYSKTKSFLTSCGTKLLVRHKFAAKYTLHKGIRLYAEITRASISACSEANNLVPDMTTTKRPFTFKPVIVPYDKKLSPIQTKSVCVGDFSFLRSPSSNYVIVIRDSSVGYTKEKRCVSKDGDCSKPSSKVDGICGGKRLCLPGLIHEQISLCSQIATYVQYTYQFLPIHSSIIGENICQTSYLFGESGYIQSPNYPTYPNTKQNCVIKLTGTTSKLYNIFIIQMDLPISQIKTSNCTNSDYIEVDDGLQSLRYCNERISGSFVFESCTNVVEITLSSTTRTDDDQTYKGMRIYYESIVKPLNWQCQMKKTLPPIIQTTTAAPSSVNDIKSQKKLICTNNEIQKLSCDQPDTFIAFEAAQFGVSITHSCQQKSTDCYFEASYVENTCGGLNKCQFYAKKKFSNSCNNTADYLYLRYLCVPQSFQQKTTLCSAQETILNGVGTIELNGANTGCTHKFKSNNLQQKIQIISYRIILPYPSFSTFKCKANTAMSLTDGLVKEEYCGHVRGKILMNTCENEFSITIPQLSANYKIKLIYVTFQRSPTDTCKVSGQTITTSSPGQLPGYATFKRASDLLIKTVCRTKFIDVASCPTNYMISVFSSVYRRTNQICGNGGDECTRPTDDGNKYCTSQSCTLMFGSSSLNLMGCAQSPNDQTHVVANTMTTKYHCVPQPSIGDILSNECQGTKEISVYKGFIVNKQDASCTIKIKNSLQKSIHIWLLSSSLPDADTTGKCIKEQVKISQTSGIDQVLCGEVTKPILIVSTKSQYVQVNFDSSMVNRASGSNTFEMYYEINGNGVLTTTTEISTTSTSTTTTKRIILATTTKPQWHKKKKNIGGIVFLVLFILALAGFVAMALYRKFIQNQQPIPPVMVDYTNRAWIFTRSTVNSTYTFGRDKWTQYRNNKTVANINNNNATPQPTTTTNSNDKPVPEMDIMRNVTYSKKDDKSADDYPF
ncbi:hypothetical protein SNEBB_001977 [Seison nebaliae]|nr:hypothetical protein SNEBB_001977 [Seison nebaliae]